MEVTEDEVTKVILNPDASKATPIEYRYAETQSWYTTSFFE